MSEAGVVFGESDAQRIIEAVRYYEMLRGPRSRQLLAGSRAPASASPVLVRCTSATADADGNYPGVVTWPDGSGGWTDADTACRLKTADGSVPVSGTRYMARPAAGQSGNVVFVTVPPGAGGGGGGLTIAEVDGSPSYSSVTTLTVDQSDGLTLTQPGGAGTVRLDIAAASLTSNGIMTTGTQFFAGAKVWSNGLMSFGGDTSGTTLQTVDFVPSCIVTTQADFFFGNPWNATYGNATRKRDGGKAGIWVHTTTAAGSTWNGFFAAGYDTNTHLAMVGAGSGVGADGTNDNQVTLRVCGRNNGGTYPIHGGCLLRAVTGSASDPPLYGVEAGGTKTWGVTGTAAGGATVTGGLVTGLGTALRRVAVPATAASAGTVGDIAWDASHIYTCHATNTWRRVAVATF